MLLHGKENKGTSPTRVSTKARAISRTAIVAYLLKRFGGVFGSLGSLELPKTGLLTSSKSADVEIPNAANRRGLLGRAIQANLEERRHHTHRRVPIRWNPLGAPSY